MDFDTIRRMLEDLKSGAIDVDSVIGCLRSLPYDDIGCAKIDTHRGIRTGFPEVVFCPGKTNDQITEILKRLSCQSKCVIATRAESDVYQSIKSSIPEAKYIPEARIIVVGELSRTDEEVSEDINYILVLCAGTADIPVAQEAAATARILGSRVEKVFDVGVAGIHRLLRQRELLENANVIIAIAGMEGALASVVGGLVSRPVIAVPTSVGYGASFGGLSALLTMLNSCAVGVSVVNIDNGFGAGYLAHLINKPKK